MSWDFEAFLEARDRRLKVLSGDVETRSVAREFVRASYRRDYCYLWDWAGFPILQMPEDVMAMQEILFRCRPNVVIETGVAWGGSSVMTASVMSLYEPNGKVLGLDLNLREELASAVENLNFPVKPEFFNGDSTSVQAIEWVQQRVSKQDRIMVVLDSHHTHDHVLNELRLYSLFVSPGQYLLVGDTSVVELAEETERVRAWSSQSNPMSAVRAFLEEQPEFKVDEKYEAKLLTTFHPSGYLRREE